MQERLGNRYWSGPGNPPALQEPGTTAGAELPSGGLVEDQRAWARVEGARTSLQPDVGIDPAPEWDMDIWQLQVGIDRPVRDTGDGVLIGGVTFNYGTVSTDVSGSFGEARSTPRAMASAAA